METLISSITASGPDPKRPPHILLLMARPPEVPKTVTASEDTQRPRRRGVLIAAAALAGLLAGLGGVYGIAGMTRNPDAALCQGALDAAKRIAPLAHGEVAALTVASEPLRVPDLTFRDGD